MNLLLFLPVTLVKYKYMNTLLLTFAFIFFLHSPYPSSSNSVSLQWDKNLELNINYHLHYGTTSGVYPNAIDTLSSTTATVSNLTPGKTYFFVVTAYDSNSNESAFSNEVNFTIPFLPTPTPSPSPSPTPSPSPHSSPSNTPCAPPLIPSFFAGSVTASNKVLLTWQDNSNNETGFRIQRSLNNSSFKTIVTLPTNSSSYTDNSPLPHKIYKYRMGVINACGPANNPSVLTITIP